MMKILHAIIYTILPQFLGFWHIVYIKSYRISIFNRSRADGFTVLQSLAPAAAREEAAPGAGASAATRLGCGVPCCVGLIVQDT